VCVQLRRERNLAERFANWDNKESRIMTRRRVTHTGKDRDGDITSLCSHGQFWSPRAKRDAIYDIESGAHSYYVLWSDGKETEIRVVNGRTGKYLRTDRDSTERNNLDDLPNC